MNVGLSAPHAAIGGLGEERGSFGYGGTGFICAGVARRCEPYLPPCLPGSRAQIALGAHGAALLERTLSVNLPILMACACRGLSQHVPRQVGRRRSRSMARPSAPATRSASLSTWPPARVLQPAAHASHYHSTKFRLRLIVWCGPCACVEAGFRRKASYTTYSLSSLNQCFMSRLQGLKYSVSEPGCLLVDISVDIRKCCSNAAEAVL